ncbi:MAG: outer membrane beta-barrel protein, partial [Hyphococcus sp.]
RNGNDAGVVSIAGVNPRFNALALDGVLQGDDFGLSSSIYATERAPISLAAIENASVVATDYDVTSSGFQGGLINVVTKSGTNEFHGSGYWFRSGQDFLGELSDGALVPAPEFEEREWGFSLGGPIIKDRLFFFANYERFNAATPENFAGDDLENGITNADAFFSALGQRVADGTGFNPGGRPVAVSLPARTNRFLGKIDFNINEDHRLEASYQRTRETGTSVDSTSFASAFYDIPQQLDSYSGTVYSDWTDQLSTQVRVGYKDFMRGQNCRAGSDFSEIQLRLDAADFAIDPVLAGAIDPMAFPSELQVRAGCDRFRHGNEFDDSRLQVFAAADYQWGDHVTTFGGEFEDYDLRNLFLSDSNGT